MYLIFTILGCSLGALALYDLTQRKHAILRNFPIVGHLRYILEAIGPELRQYIVTNNDEERPFSRDQRRWVYASSKLENNYFGFGSDNDMENTTNYLILKHAAFPHRNPHQGAKDYDPLYGIPCGKVLGAARGRAQAFRPESAINISGMSYGSLSGSAVQAINQGCKIAHCLHNTGEGGISRYHEQGGELIWQIGTGYFGCCDEDGQFSLERLVEQCQQHPVRALEIKLSQGAKPGLGGILPAAKVTHEISKTRGIPLGKDCMSPASHREFQCLDSLLDFVETLADATGLPVGIKSAIGQKIFWTNLAAEMSKGTRGVDFIAIDGAEGGTGAAPLVFSDHVSLPFRIAFSRVYREFAEQGIADDLSFIASAKLGFPENAALAFALGADMVHVAREAMLAIGCIQAQRCHTGHCPAGIATQNKWLVRGLDPEDKAARLGNYIITLRKELLNISRACGVPHPAMLTSRHIEVIDGQCKSQSLQQLFAYQPDWGLPSSKQQAWIRDNMI